MTTLLILIGLLILSVFLFLNQNKFGKAPDQKRMKKYALLFNYKNGKFQNLSETPELTNGHSMIGVMYDYFFKKSKRIKPSDVIPSVKLDLLNIPLDSQILVWFGHSSYFMQIDGKRILVDPVFSGNASPISGTNRAFPGTDRYSVRDLPTIDYLFITHDHYDHLDYPTILELLPKVKKVICGLGVGAHLEYWGYAPDLLHEMNWYESIALDSGFTAFCEPAMHFSGRSFSRNNTLWASFLLQTPNRKIYIGGDSGYDTHFADIGKRHGPIDLAILDNGQYDLAWQNIHNLPEEVLKAAHDLQARCVFPVHSSKFVMANHPWDEPLQRITALNATLNVPLMTPIIGEMVNLNDTNRIFKKWWKGIN